MNIHVLYNDTIDHIYIHFVRAFAHMNCFDLSETKVAQLNTFLLTNQDYTS